AIFDCNIAALNIAGLVQAQMECCQQMGKFCRGLTVQKSNNWHCRLLRPRRERPRGCRAAKKRYERAALHSITSSAATSSLSGTVSPSILAVCWLMTSSNLLD